MYVEKIWDHASGWLLVHEAGGRVTDAHGKPLNFAAGRALQGSGACARSPPSGPERPSA
jgi:3'(2'), 5'-bisphosphate nucleotidase